MQKLLRIDYPNAPWTREARKLSREQIAAIAWDLRKQLGCADELRPGLPFERLHGIAALNVNGIAFDLEWSLDHAVTNEQGQSVLGVCEYDHEGLPGAALLHVNSEIVNGRAELLLSTAAHELGHAIFDASSWIAIAQTPVLHGLVDDQPRRVQRITSPDESHLKPGTGAGIVTDWREWRANEFMGCLLVPRDLLRLLLLAIAREMKVPLRTESAQASWLGDDPHDCVLAASGPSMKLQLLIGALAHGFGVSRRFMEVRLKRYGYLDLRYGQAA